MKRKLLVSIMAVALIISGCSGKDTSTTEEKTEKTEQTTVAEEEKVMKISDEQALEAIKKYCCEMNPDLEDKLDSEDYEAYFEVESSSEDQIVVLYRSYTGAQVRYYIDTATGETYSTEFVPNITDEEEKTDESLNVKDYIVVPS
ncbi:MAG: hypothetical protein J6U54_14650 [Clostridiales bacterium]|nr:hypothetical protein [Clostridiales bacterium]